MTRWRMTPRGLEPTNERQQKIVSLIRAGVRLKDIAAAFSLSVPRISQLRHQAGIPRRIQPK